jgi:hypothetical protein
MLKYKDLNEGAVLTVFLCAYVFMQSFAIPGSIVFSLLSGPLFGPIRGWCLVCFATTSGAIACYFVSNLFMRRILLAHFPARVAFLEQKVVENTDNIFYFLLSLRMSPLLPNWFINAASPVAGIPLRKFAAATFIGLMPINFLHVQAGERVRRRQPTVCLQCAPRRLVSKPSPSPPFPSRLRTRASSARRDDAGLCAKPLGRAPRLSARAPAAFAFAARSRARLPQSEEKNSRPRPPQARVVGRIRGRSGRCRRAESFDVCEAARLV